MSGFAVARSMFARLRGLFAYPPGSDTVLMLAPCRDIHTVGMREAIDVAFLDERGTVVLARRDVGANRRIRYPYAAAVLERRARPGQGWFTAGDCASELFPQVDEALADLRRSRGRKGAIEGEEPSWPKSR